MQDTDPFFDPEVVMYRIAEELWPDLQERFPELRVHIDARGRIVPTRYGEPEWEAVTAGFFDGNFLLRPGVDLHNCHHIFLFFGGARVSVDQWGMVYRYAGKVDPVEHYLCCIVSDVLRDIRSEAEPSHVEASIQDLPPINPEGLLDVGFHLQ